MKMNSDNLNMPHLGDSVEDILALIGSARRIAISAHTYPDGDAVGSCLAAKRGTAVRMALREPGGTIITECDPDTGETHLFGTVRLIAQYNSFRDE